jgi:chromosome segregation ATPase
MNALDIFQKRLRDETATVEQEIQSHNQQLEALNQRLEGLKRAAELFESEQAALSELLQVGTANGGAIARAMPTTPAVKVQKATVSPKPTDAQKRRAPITQSHGKTPAGRATRKASQNSDLTRVDMIAAVLKRYPRRTVRELIALLNKEYRWKTTESAVTNNLYTRRDKFVHTQADRSTNRPVTWSLK